MFATILSLLVTNLAGPLINLWATTKNVDLQKFQTAVGADKDTILALLKTESEANATRATLAQMYFGSLPFRILMWFAIAFPVGHMALVFVDSSCPHGCGLGIPALPKPYDDHEWQIIVTLLGIQKITPIVAGFFTKALYPKLFQK